MIGRVLAEKFKIVSLIARGGMGKVYRAVHAHLHSDSGDSRLRAESAQGHGHLPVMRSLA